MTRRNLIRVVATAAACLALFVGRTVYEQQDHFSRAEAFMAANERKLALREYDTALHFHWPGSPWTGSAARRLWELGEVFENEGRIEEARAAYGAVRSSFYACRSFYTPGRGWIERSDEKLASLAAALLVADGTLPPEEAGPERERFLKVFRADRAPSVPWSVLAGAAFLGWCSTALALALGAGRNGMRRRITGMALMGVFYALWVAGLFMA
jgi:hypothetical protein